MSDNKTFYRGKDCKPAKADCQTRKAVFLIGDIMQTHDKHGRPTAEYLLQAEIDDLLIDADYAERQAKNGPFYPERGITRDTLIMYAAKCLKEAEDKAGVAIEKTRIVHFYC